MVTFICAHCSRRFDGIMEWLSHRTAKLDDGGCDVIGRLLEKHRALKRASNPMPEAVKKMLRERTKDRVGVLQSRLRKRIRLKKVKVKVVRRKR